MAFYPDRICQILGSEDPPAPPLAPTGTGTAGSFVCGCAARSVLSIDTAAGTIEALSFVSNGCGYMVAAGRVLIKFFRHDELSDLHGLDEDEVVGRVAAALGGLPADRVHCARVAVEALQAAFADHRQKQVDEFRGERALVCTCFGISEDTIEEIVAGGSVRSVEEITSVCRAGAGCGSCRMIIADMIDEHFHQK